MHLASTVCVVGESGCGKTVSPLSVLKLIAMPHGRIVEGHILCGRDVISFRSTATRSIAFAPRKIAIFFREPMTSLNPVYSVGDQISEVIQAGTDPQRWTVRRRCFHWYRFPIRSAASLITPSLLRGRATTGHDRDGAFIAIHSS